MNGIERDRIIRDNHKRRDEYRKSIREKFKVTDETKKNPNILPEYWYIDDYIDALEINGIYEYDRNILQTQSDNMCRKITKEDMVDSLKRFPKSKDSDYNKDYVIFSSTGISHYSYDSIFSDDDCEDDYKLSGNTYEV